MFEDIWRHLPNDVSKNWGKVACESKLGQVQVANLLYDTRLRPEVAAIALFVVR